MEIHNGDWKVYIHTNKINGKMYIGITSTSLKRRFGANGNGYNDHPKFWNAIKKYGWENFIHEIFASNLTYEEACNMERLLIIKLNTIACGYNNKDGGNGGKLSQEVKNKIKEKRAKQITTKESIEKMAATHRGTHHNYETIQKMRNAALNRSVAVFCIETNEMFVSISDAARTFNVSPSAIANSCERYKNNVPQRNRGFHFKYAQQ